MPTGETHKLCPTCGRSDEMHGAELKLNNRLLEVLAAFNKFQPTVEAILDDARVKGKAVADLPEVVDTKHNYLISQQNIHHSNVQAALEKHLQQANERHDKVVGFVIEIQKATALTQAASAGAEEAADDAAAAAVAARVAHETGPHPLVDQHGQPLHGGPRQPQEREESRTPDSVTGVARSWVRGLLAGMPSWMKFILAVLTIGAAVYSGQQLEAKLNRPARERRELPVERLPPERLELPSHKE